MLQEQKPKKTPRKKPKPSAMTRPAKRNKKKKKISLMSDTLQKPQQLPIVIHPQHRDQPMSVQPNYFNQDDFIHHSSNSGSCDIMPQTGPYLTYHTDDMIMDKILTTSPNKLNFKNQHQYPIQASENGERNINIIDKNYRLQQQKSKATLPMLLKNNQNIKLQHGSTQDLLNICENSYESSKDTGLSESELMKVHEVNGKWAAASKHCCKY